MATNPRIPKSRFEVLGCGTCCIRFTRPERRSLLPHAFRGAVIGEAANGAPTSSLDGLSVDPNRGVARGPDRAAHSGRPGRRGRLPRSPTRLRARHPRRRTSTGSGLSRPHPSWLEGTSPPMTGPTTSAGSPVGFNSRCGDRSCLRASPPLFPCGVVQVIIAPGRLTTSLPGCRITAAR